MFIAINVPGMPFNGATISSGKSLGGSESAGYYMAKALAARGHKVIVFTNSTETGTWDGVTYEHLGQATPEAPLGDKFAMYMQTPYDVCVIQRHPNAFLRPVNSKINMWWLHDLALKRSFPHVTQQLMNIDKVITVSESHRQQVADVYDIDPKHILPSFNGLNYNEYVGLPNKREDKSLIFASRPERGLEELVKPGGIMEKMPDYKLYVCSYDNTTPDMRPFYEYMWRRCDELPNVVNLGHLGKRQLAEAMATKQAYAYPTTFEDTSCMIALEANACGTPFIGFKTGALPETIGNGGSVLLDLKEGQVDHEAFISAVRETCETKDVWSDLNNRAKAKRQTWDAAAEQWEKEIENIFRAKTSDTTRLYTHFENLSDIVAIEKHAEKTGSQIPEHIKKLYSFYFERDKNPNSFKDHYAAYYQYEKERGVDYGPEDVSHTGRYQYVLQEIQKAKPKTVLDYGCAHGHYTVNLAKTFPDIQFEGVDLEDSNVATGNKWAADEKVSNVSFRQGQAVNLEPGKYDMVVAGEVIEHVADPRELVGQLTRALKPGGVMVVTVPMGPWEALGYAKHPGWRAHLHHIERADLQDLFGNQQDYKIIVIPSPGRPGLGHIIATFKKSDTELGHIDYDRKILQQSPIETLSVCMIAKDAALDIAKCLTKVRPLASEILIGIDKTTTDNTRQIADSFGAICFDIPCPLDIGFDNARNLVIQRAKGDWILWIDCDETLEQIENLPKYLRHNLFDGYAIKQHHVSVEGVHKTDLPCRIFRNTEDVMFFGHVHEHPSKKSDMNAGVGKVINLTDIDIMHNGYTTDRIRKGRFDRNFRLMIEDRKRHPGRVLGHFLWVRDCVNLIHFELMANGKRITDSVMQHANSAIATWHQLLESKNIRLIIESLPWYSDCAKLVSGNQGMEVVTYLDAVRGAGQQDIILDKAMDPRNRIAGYFLNADDAEKFLAVLQDLKLEGFKHKYY